MADPSLRRYATRMSGVNADAVLRRAYVAAARSDDRVLVGGRPSIRLFRQVHTNAALAAATEPVKGAPELENLLRSTPVAERGALLLTTVERLPVGTVAQVLGVGERSVIELTASATSRLLPAVTPDRTAER
ncbi:MAG: hypothetical protein ACR2QK_00845, partial [Acidimicrobiales bacterium]